MAAQALWHPPGQEDHILSSSQFDRPMLDEHDRDRDA